MHQFSLYQLNLHQLKLISSIALLTLVSCTRQSNATFATPSADAPPASVKAQAQPDQASGTPSTTHLTAVKAATGNLLSPAQVAKLTQLPIPIAAPTDLPTGFRVVSANGDSVKYINGDDDAGYAIEYEKEDGTCFAVQSSKDGPRRLKPIGQVESVMGTIKIYELTYQDKKALQSFIPVKGNPVMISPVARFSQSTGDYVACRPLDRTEYERILKSMEIVK